MRVKVYAKLNLTLSVGARQGEFHPIDSVATSIDLYDTVEVLPRADRAINVHGVDNIPTDTNTAYSAACAFVEAFSAPGVDISIQKGIPFGGGLGGSSADAAAVLYCMCRLHGVDVGCGKVREICSKLGCDVTFMLRGGLGRLRGKGDEVEYFALAHPLYFALTTFAQEMSSREVYSSFDRINKYSFDKDKLQQPFADERNTELLTLLQQGASKKALQYLYNDLQPAATAINGYAEQYLKLTEAHGLCTVMTGSGSAYYVAFTSRAEAENAVDLLNSQGYSTILCQTVSCGIEV